MLTSPICCYLYPGGSSPPPHPTPSFLSPPSAAPAAWKLGLAASLGRSKGGSYPHRTELERAVPLQSSLARGRGGTAAAAGGETALSSPSRGCRGALLSSCLSPAVRWGLSVSRGNAVLQFLEEPALLCSVSLAWRARAVQGRSRSPGPHSTFTALGDVLGRAVTVQGSLGLLGKLRLHPALEFGLQVLVL